jgi:hypothetical protein
MKHADGKEALDLAEGEVGGWFVHTHSSTQGKMGYVRKVAAALNLPVKIAGV